MSTDIQTLISDIYSLVPTKGWLHDTDADALSAAISARLQLQFTERTEKPTLRLSQMGPRCPCALWYSLHHPELAESLPPWAEIKFSYGHVLEALVITLAKAAGHKVEGEQGHVELDNIVGHTDCIIDGCVVDVKSASSRSFIKFKDRSIVQNDPFGYLSQLDGYVVGNRNNPLVTFKNTGYLLAVDKTLGHLCLYKHEVTNERERWLRDRIKAYKQIAAQAQPPSCECISIPHGTSGNLQLDTKAGYSAYKYCCKPGLRTFIYANGPAYLTKVVRKPDVPEIDRYGNAVYN